MPKNRILNESVLIQERRVASSTSEVKCPNCMDDGEISDSILCTIPRLHQQSRLVLHVNVVNNVFALYTYITMTSY